MRPRKVILCIDDSEYLLSLQAYMLEINGYRVLQVTETEGAICVLQNSPVDLVICDFAMPGMDGRELIGKLKALKGHVPMILLGDPKQIGNDAYAADAVLSKKLTTPAELLERVKMMCARKCGPRPGFRRVPQQASLATQ